MNIDLDTALTVHGFPTSDEIQHLVDEVLDELISEGAEENVRSNKTLLIVIAAAVMKGWKVGYQEATNRRIQ